MKQRTISCLVALLVLGGLTACNQAANDQTSSDPGSAGAASARALSDLAWTPPALAEEDWQEPDGREVIQRHVDFMQAQQELMTEALVSYEAVQESGQKLHFDLLQRMAVRKPDKLHWVTLHDDGTIDSAWLSDGRFTLLKQPANIWGQIDAPPSISLLVDRLQDEYDLDVPFGNLLARDPEEPLLGEDVMEVWWVGEAWVEGHWTDHVAVRRPGVDFQLWVRKGDEPFVAKLAIVYTEEEGQPVYVARFRQWATSVPEAITDFTFAPPVDAEEVEVVPVTDR
jgi:hypothetical protein